MPTVDHVLYENDVPLSEEAERGTILASVYAQLLGGFVAERRADRSKALIVLAVGFLVGVTAVSIALMQQEPLFYAGAAAGLTTLVGGAAWLTTIKRRRPRARVVKLGRVYWQGTVLPFEGDTAVLIDRTGLVRPQSFSLPFVPDGPDRLAGLVQRCDRLGDDLPVILERDSSDPSGAKLHGVEHELNRIVDEIDSVLGDVRKLEVQLAAVPAKSDLATELMRARDTPRQGAPGTVLTDPSADEDACRESLGKLRQATQMDRDERRKGKRSLDGLASDALERCDRSRQQMADARRAALITQMNGAIQRLRTKFFFPLIRVYCPHCVKDLWDGSAGGSEFREEAVAMDREDADRLQLHRLHGQAARLRYSLDRRVWQCPQCNRSITPSEKKLVSFKIKEDLIFPVWEHLWMELEQEKGRIVRDKEREMRDRKAEEEREYRDNATEFASERRDLMAQLENQYAAARKARGKIGGMIESFAARNLIRASHASELNRNLDASLTEAEGKKRAFQELFGEKEQELRQLPGKMGQRRESEIAKVAAYTDLNSRHNDSLGALSVLPERSARGD